MAKKTKNYLDFVPIYSPEYEWDADDDGMVTIHVVHRSFYAAVARKLFHTPRINHIHLDRYGSFLWGRIDGKKDVGQLADEVRRRFGDEAEPLYDRLVQYMPKLRNNRLILFLGEDRMK